MKIKTIIIIFSLLLSVCAFSQQVSNIHFEQKSKQIYVYYDLYGNQTYTVQVFCSTDNGNTWGNPLQKVSGAVGKNQKPGNGKMIVWDVLAEREKLLGYIRFKIKASVGNKGTFTDGRDGQTYKTVVIGSQTWFAENLNYQTSSNSRWYGNRSANGNIYGNRSANGNIYGRLYTWDAAKTACPSGWHLPSDNEWKTLEMHLGMSQSEADDTGWRGTDEGKKMKSTSGWNSGGNGTNSSGFNALPGGYRRSSGSFYFLGNNGYWWSSTENSGTLAWYRRLHYAHAQVRRHTYYKTRGFSVRCLKN